MNICPDLPEINPETRARIIAAANQIHEQNGRSTYPKVDEVRRVAKVGMNDASAIMKEWRRHQTKPPATAAVALPDRLRQAHETALAATWAEAQGIATEALKLAQAAWETERAEAETLRLEMATAFESQARELDSAHLRIADLEARAEQSAAQVQLATQHLQDAQAAKSEAERRAALAEQRAQDIERQASILQAELKRAHQRTEIAEQHLNEATAKIERTASTISELRENAARLRGELEASRVHAKLMKLLENREKPNEGKKKS